MMVCSQKQLNEPVVRTPTSSVSDQAPSTFAAQQVQSTDQMSCNVKRLVGTPTGDFAPSKLST